jgi:hypothetical protein
MLPFQTSRQGCGETLQPLFRCHRLKPLSRSEEEIKNGASRGIPSRTKFYSTRTKYDNLRHNLVQLQPVVRPRSEWYIPRLALAPSPFLLVQELAQPAHSIPTKDVIGCLLISIVILKYKAERHRSQETDSPKTHRWGGIREAMHSLSFERWNPRRGQVLQPHKPLYK